METTVLIKRGTADGDGGHPVDITVLVMIDLATGLIEVYTKAATSNGYTIEAMQHFAVPKDNIKTSDCDIAPELLAGARHCMWRLVTATTRLPQTNGVVERGVRTVKDGGRCGVVQTGFSPAWWPTASEHFCFSKVITEVDGDSPCNKKPGNI